MGQVLIIKKQIQMVEDTYQSHRNHSLVLSELK